MQHEGVPNFLPDGAFQGYTNIIINVSELQSLDICHYGGSIIPDDRHIAHLLTD